ncbi:MAG: alpha-galactosidase [Candidatus Omnitrophota bacterium]
MSKYILNEASLKLARDWSKAAFGGLVDSNPQVAMECRCQGWGFPKHGRSITDEPLCIGGRVFSSGIGTHADSEIALKLPSRGKRFCAFAGMDRNKSSLTFPSSQKERIVFSVEAGGKELFASEPLGLVSPPLEVQVDLNGTSELTMKTREINGCIILAHADWADIRIEIENGTAVSVGMPVQKLPFGVPPISFTMDGQSSAEVLARSRFAVEIFPTGDSFARKKAVWNDPVTGLTVAVEATEFTDFPAVEYVLRLKNNGRVNTPIIADILSADFSWPAATTTMLYRSRGAMAAMDDFQYLKESLAPGTNVRMTPGVDGRSSYLWLPFFNVETDKEGFVMAIGWTGAWLADFNRVDDDLLKIRAGLERTRISLHPGEEIRLPRILLVFWEGEPLTGHNLLRRFLVRHGTPRPGGQPPLTPVSFATWGATPTSAHLERIRKLEAEHADCDCYWMDAGWFGPKRTPVDRENWYTDVGHWSINPGTHPNGLRPISDAARKAGMKFILWLEPERAWAGTLWPKEHPEWFISPSWGGEIRLLNLGIPEARRFLTDYVSSLIERDGVDIYRQDFNMAPLLFWRNNDPQDRQGMTEIRHIEGLYEFWDELRRRHPHLLIDNCAGGGKRIDLETIRRSIPLWRSDYQCNPKLDATDRATGSQIHGIGLNYWVPFSATGTFVCSNDTYDFRSALAAGIVLEPLIDDAIMAEMPKDYSWQWLRTMIAQLKRCRPAFAGDFYPLLSGTASTNKDVWAAYQMHRDDLGEGFFVVFRREQCPFLSAQLVLQGLDGNKRYVVEDANTGEKREAGGDVLLSAGFLVHIPKPRESRLFFLRAL